MRCSNCGSKNRDDAKFCRKCGAPLHNSERKGCISKGLLRLLAILALASIIASGLYIVRSVTFSKTDGDGGASNQLAVANLHDRNIRVEDEESARNAIKSLSTKLPIGSSSNQLGDCRTDSAYGWTYYRFKQEVDGYEVQGCTLTLGVNEDGIADSLTSNAISLEEGKREAKISRTDAEDAIASAVDEDCDVSIAELVLYPSGKSKATLCYRSYVSTPDGAKFVFVSAEDGSLVAQQALSFTEQVEGRGKTKASPSVEVPFMTEHEGTTYTLFDEGRGITVFDAKGKNVNAALAYADQSGKQYKYDEKSDQLIALDDGSTRAYGDDCEYVGLYLSTRGVIGRLEVATNDSTYWSDRTAVSAMHNVSMAHDFYASVLDRNGFSDTPLHNVFVCINTFSQTNSQWGRTDKDAVIRFESDNAIKLDTAAHEFTHNVEQSISTMTYEGESGALMEATSDIFAELAEDFADDGQMNNTCDWKQSDLRDLANPEKSPIAERKTGKNRKAHATRYLEEDAYWASTTPKYDKNGETSNDRGHVHNNSTVVSHAAYLMCNGNIDGEELTTKELADVLYATFHVLPSNCDFMQYAGWVQYKAQTMLTSLKARRVKEAFEVVGVIGYIENASTLPNSADSAAGSDKDAAVEFVKTWYDDWTFSNGHDVANDQPLMLRCPPLIAEDSELLDEFVESCVSLDGKYSRNISTCVIEKPQAEELRDGVFRVTVRYLATQNSVDQAAYDRLFERPLEDVWDVTVNEDGKVTALEEVGSGQQVAADASDVYTAFATKIEEYLEKYGQPAMHGDGVVSADGVCLAELVDFNGDGQDELLVAYYASEYANDFYTSQGINDAAAYAVEVWSYSEGSVHTAYRRAAQFSLGGIASVSRFEEKTSSEVPKCMICGDEGEGDDYYLNLYEIDADASRVVHSYGWKGMGTEAEVLLVDGDETELEVDEWVESVSAGKMIYHLMDNEDGEMDGGAYIGVEYSDDESHSVRECLDLTKETLHRLGIKTSDSAASEEAASDTEGAFSSQVQAIEQQSKAPVAHMAITDYDGDGKNEAFVISGTQFGNSASGGGVWTDAELWFVSSSGEVEAVTTFNKLVFVNDIISDPADSGYQFLSLELTAGGSGSQSRVFGVYKGGPKELSVGGRNVQSHDGKIIMAKSIYSPHRFAWSELEFDWSSFSFLEGASLGTTDFGELP